MELHVTLTGRRSLSRQIYQQVRSAIVTGRLRPGDLLPPTRELARQLDVARNTVSVAYDRLVEDGFLDARVGAGTFVRTELRPAPDAEPPTPVGPLRPRELWSTMSGPADLSADEPAYDFRPGLPDARLFPHQSWRRLVSKELRPSAFRSGVYADPAGHAGLRASIARHIGVSRAVRTDAEGVIVTNGIQQALDLIGRTLVDPGACVALEEPVYPPARMLFRSLGARVVDVPVDAEGLVVDALPDDARCVYVTPSHQFPLGMPMSLPRRLALLEWAERHDAAIVEDDYDSEFRFAGRPIDPLHSLDPGGRVLYLGSFSKVMLPTLRLGFVVAPPSLRHALRLAKYVTDWHTGIPMQAALARFIDDGSLAKHIRAMRAEYAARHQLILDVLAAEFADLLEPIGSVAGLHLSAVAHLGAGEHVTSAVRRARSSGVAVMPLSRFTANADRPEARRGLVIGYGAITTERIPEGLSRLHACLSYPSIHSG